jgi:[calcium/calmodulin-dependent protein kinase] kinase
LTNIIILYKLLVDDITQYYAFKDEFSYVPCFTIDLARSAFRDTMLGLEYLHYKRIVH